MALDRHVRRTGSDYTRALLALLPKGQAWTRDVGSTLVRTLSGLAEYWGFVDGRAADLLEIETDPRYTQEMLVDWERNFGLPDPCFHEGQSVAERQAFLVFWMTLLGGQSKDWFFYIAGLLGYTITITEYSPWMFGVSEVGLTDDGTGYWRWEIGPPEMRFYWTVTVPATSLKWWQFNVAEFGVDPHLRIGSATDLECLFNRYKPAHTEVIFNYTEPTYMQPMALGVSS
jgi:uncharacterized protein YmfQ (DUF2313 family)